jgi:hypothetical protein
VSASKARASGTEAGTPAVFFFVRLTSDSLALC